MRGRPVLFSISLGLAAATLPTVAAAHLVTTGMGPLCDGLAHFSSSPEDYLPVLVLGLFAGLRGPRQSRLTMAALTSAWLLGGSFAVAVPFADSTVLVVATAFLFVVLGILLASNPKTAVWVGMSAGVAVGLVRGLDDLRAAPSELPTVLVLAGICGCVLVLFALAASLTLPLRRIWMITAARVAGSWLAAIGLLLAGWIIRYGSQLH
jgi:hypothetical protein